MVVVDCGVLGVGGVGRPVVVVGLYVVVVLVGGLVGVCDGGLDGVDGVGCPTVVVSHGGSVSSK